MKIVLITIALVVLVLIIASPIIFTYEAWRYEDKITDEFFRLDLPLSMIEEEKQAIDQSILDRYYLGDALFDTRTMAHNETTESGEPPYIIIIRVRIPEESSIDKVIFHNITLISSLGKYHEFHPTEVDKRGESTKALSFPVAIKPDKSRTYTPREFSVSLFSLPDLNFDPESGESIEIQIDAEIFNGDKSQRKILNHTVEPRLESGTRKIPTV